MKEYGDSPDEQRKRLRRIWEYNIEPFIEDQFFGAPDRIEHFRFNAVMKRHGPPHSARMPMARIRRLQTAPRPPAQTTPLRMATR